MNKEKVIALHSKAEHVANIYSNINREHNENKETFKVIGIQPTSKTTALVTFQKNTGKLALAWFFWKNCNKGYWDYFFPTESHIFGMAKLQTALDKVERENFKKNGC